MYKSLEEIKKEIAKTEPDVKNLLTTPMRIEDRAKLSLYYEIYKSQQPNTHEWLESRNIYNDMLKEYKVGYEYHKNYTENQLEEMKKEEEKFTGFDPQLSLKYKILELKTSPKNKEVIYRKYEEFMNMDSKDDEYGKIKNWLTWVTDIPHDMVKEIKVDNITKFIINAKEKLDKELYGMEKVKEQILLFLTAKLQNPNMIHSNLGLCGSPGTGKTAIARLISEIMDWGFSQISFGGVDKADFLKGHDYAYIGSGPGEIVKSLKLLGHKNGIIFLDEIDKINDNLDIRSALLHIIDPSQNSDFRDIFLSEIKIDLSKIWWVGSMNSIPKDDALADRWYIIEVEGYSVKDKIQIIENYLLPKALINARKK